MKRGEMRGAFMLPQSLSHYSVGPFFGFATNAVMTLLCLVTLALYRHYRPLRSLFLFYLFSAFLFLGWVVYGLQKSPGSILLGYRIDLASLALLPASWVWFTLALFNERPRRLPWVVTGISLCLSALALLGKGPWFLGLPLEAHQVAVDILRPQSKLLRPLIHSFCLVVCLFYFFLIIIRLIRSKAPRPGYLLPVAIGLFFWFMGGLHDAIRSTGMTLFSRDQVLWFTSFWLSILLTIAVALHFRSLEQAVREARDVFERFVPPAYLRRIAAEGLGAIRLGEADQQCVTILCCDIRGFTPLSQRLNPSQLVAFVNQLFERITSAVNGRQGVIDKFLGDAVLCIFEEPRSAERAVSCGLDVLSAVKSFNAERNLSSDQIVKVGIGVHRGPVILGTIGSSDRMDSTVLGLTVNLAKRLEEVTRPLDVDMIISEEVVQQLPKEHDYRLRKIGKVLVRGYSEPVAVAEVFDRDPQELRDLKERTKPILSEGVDLLEADCLEDALLKFQEAQALFLQDRLLQLMISSLRKNLEQGPKGERGFLLDFR
ncbi:MAG: adenylate/guanylate cyclase domain-containing protein [Thermodesulfobacteriota bacterium]